jgi:hypothetical protein
MRSSFKTAPQYRIWFWDSGGCFSSIGEFHCGDDEEALELARACLSRGGQGLVWCGSRRVGSISVSPKPLNLTAEFKNAAGSQSTTALARDC